MALCSLGSFSKANGFENTPRPIITPSIPYCSTSFRPVKRSGISPLIVSNVWGATSSRSFLISPINSQCAATLLISSLVRRWIERLAISCFKICVSHSRHSATSVKPSLVLTLTGKPPALAAWIISAARSGWRINPAPLPLSATLSTGQPILISIPLKPNSFIPILIWRKCSGLSPQICATIGCSSSVKAKRLRTLSNPSGWQ